MTVTFEDILDYVANDPILNDWSSEMLQEAGTLVAQVMLKFGHEWHGWETMSGEAPTTVEEILADDGANEFLFDRGEDPHVAGELIDELKKMMEAR